MKQSFQIVVIICLCFSLSGCLSPVKNEIPLAQVGVLEKPSNTNDTKLVIFNDSDFLGYGLDGSGRINVQLNGKGIAQVGIGRYAQVVVPKGKYQVGLTHFDTARFPSQHELEFDQSLSFLEIFATPTSNKAFLISHLPPNFDQKFKPVK